MIMHHGFEGAEKSLELEFSVPEDNRRGIRFWKRVELDKLLTIAQCTILHETKTDDVDAYIISESSLFIYRDNLVLKTCGRTPLLDIVPAFLDLAAKSGFSVVFILYRRKNLLWPEQQIFPHGNPRAEEAFLNRHFPYGEGYLMGPSSGDHWYLYIADNCQPPYANPQQTLEIMMHECDHKKLVHFWNHDGKGDAVEATRVSGIGDLLPNSTIQECMFAPCGYSMNGILDKYYWTIHVTPEDHCSYASFETNAPMKDYSKLIKSVLNIFSPKLAVVAVIADLESACGAIEPVSPNALEGFKLRNRVHTTFEGDYHCWMYRLRAINVKEDRDVEERWSSQNNTPTHQGGSSYTEDLSPQSENSSS